MRTSSLAAVLLVLGPAHVANGALAGQEQADAGLVTSAQILEWLRHPDDLAVRYTAVSAVRTFIKRQQPSRPEVDALVDSLVTLSTTGDDREARAFAVMALLAWARNDESAGSTGRNIATLEQVYFELPSVDGKAMILGEIRDLDGGPPATGFLRRAALDEQPGFDGLPAIAVRELARMGEPGRAVLRELHDQDLVPTALGRSTLTSLATRRFRPGG